MYRVDGVAYMDYFIEVAWYSEGKPNMAVTSAQTHSDQQPAVTVSV